MPRLLEFEINDFTGLATSDGNPQKNQCNECKNFDLRYKKGELYLRPGFTTQYVAIANADHRTKLSNLSYLAIENFIPEGTTQEVTVWVVKGLLAGEEGTASAAPSSIDIITIFTSHQFNGTAWVGKNWDGTTNGKYWLNHCILTKITTSGIGSPNTWEITLDMDTSSFASDSLNGWSIYNTTKDDVAQVIDSVLTGTSMRVDISKSVHNWEPADEVILMRNYIPYTELRELSNATISEVVFHKVLNDLRIGFGGKANRTGLSIGYRKKAFNIGGTITSGLNVTSAATINNIVLDPYNIPQTPNAYLLRELSKSAGTTPVGNYFFILTALLDDFSEIQILRSNILLDADSDISLTPALKIGEFNKRITKLRLYISSNATTDTEAKNPYFFLKEYSLSQTTYNGGAWYISEDGYLHLPVATSELMTTQNAAINSATDYNTVTGFTTNNPLYTITSVAAVPAPALGTYCAKVINTDTATKTAKLTYTKTDLFDYDKTYVISFRIYHNAAASAEMKVSIDGSNYSTQYPVAGAWRTISLIIKCFNPDGFDKLTIQMVLATTEYFAIDALSIKERGTEDITLTSITGLTIDVVDRMGYNPTFDMVKGWDQAVVTQGRTFFVNPYIEKRYENKIFSSHISGAGAFMYDVASAERYIDLENFDGNNLVGIAVLPNLDFLALKKSSVQYVDPDTGRPRGIYFLDGAIARRSIVNFGDKVIWCGENDIYVSNGLNVESLTDGTIREEYRALTTKANIVAVREEKDNAYRFFTANTTTKVEYILTKRGWIKRVNGGSGIYPETYSLSKDGTVWFLRSGVIYADSILGTDAGADLTTPEWRSVDIDAEKMGEGFRRSDFFYLKSVWIDYSSLVSAGLLMTLGVYLDGSLFQEFSFTTAGVGSKKVKHRLKIGGLGRKFYIKVTLADDGFGVVGNSITIQSIGVEWTPVVSKVIRNA